MANQAQTTATTATESALAAKLQKIQALKKEHNKKMLRTAAYGAGVVGAAAALYVGARMLHQHCVKSYPLETAEADAAVSAANVA